MEDTTSIKDTNHKNTYDQVTEILDQLEKGVSDAQLFEYRLLRSLFGRHLPGTSPN